MSRRAGPTGTVPWLEEPGAREVTRQALARAGRATRTCHDLFLRLDARGQVELRLVDLERFVADALDLVRDDGRRLDLWVRFITGGPDAGLPVQRALCWSWIQMERSEVGLVPVRT